MTTTTTTTPSIVKLIKFRPRMLSFWFAPTTRPPGFSEIWRSGSMGGSQSLVLDSDKGELVKANGKVEKKGEILEGKSKAALKSHSEAERRRRERINAHLDTLRGLIPSTEKVIVHDLDEYFLCYGFFIPDALMGLYIFRVYDSLMHLMDKAALLAEVIGQVKQLKNTANEATKGLNIPMDADEVKVEPLDDRFTFMASLCCDYKPDLLSDIKLAFSSLHLNIVKAEISTLGGRVKYVFVFTGERENCSVNAESHQLLVSSLHQALSSILDKISVSSEYSPRTTLPNKKRRVSLSGAVENDVNVL
ncbi:hypothetical protein LguiB_004892 [Lonicera macranthoides]